MPEALERALKAEAKKRGYGKERADKLVYGTMVNRGWRPKKQKKGKKK